MHFRAIFEGVPQHLCGRTLVSISRQLTSRHFSVANSENVIFLSRCGSSETLPVKAYTWLVNYLSREGDAVVDVGSNTGYTMVAALKEGRNAEWLSTALQSELVRLQTRLSTLLFSET